MNIFEKSSVIILDNFPGFSGIPGFRSPIYSQVENREFPEKPGIPGIVNNEYL